MTDPACWNCGEAVTNQDPHQWVSVVDPDGKPKQEAAHAECMALCATGHFFDVCRCTGWDVRTRAAARELQRRLQSAANA